VQQLSNIRNVTAIEIIKKKNTALLAAYVGGQKFHSTCSFL